MASEYWATSFYPISVSVTDKAHQAALRILFGKKKVILKIFPNLYLLSAHGNTYLQMQHHCRASSMGSGGLPVSIGYIFLNKVIQLDSKYREGTEIPAMKP